MPKDLLQEWQRLDAWLWCARVRRARAECSALIVAGAVRINRLPTDKPHARVRPGDVLTLALDRDVRVWRVRALADRRGPAAVAAQLYEPIDDADP